MGEGKGLRLYKKNLEMPLIQQFIIRMAKAKNKQTHIVQDS
jgi:hypothetical protein